MQIRDQRDVPSMTIKIVEVRRARRHRSVGLSRTVAAISKLVWEKDGQVLKYSGRN